MAGSNECSALGRSNVGPRTALGGVTIDRCNDRRHIGVAHGVISAITIYCHHVSIHWRYAW